MPVTPQIANGWVVVPCDAHDMATVELSVSQTQRPGQWVPAFRDWHEGKRVAQARSVPGKPGGWNVWLRIDGRVAGPYRLLVAGR